MDSGNKHQAHTYLLPRGVDVFGSSLVGVLIALAGSGLVRVCYYTTHKRHTKTSHCRHTYHIGLLTHGVGRPELDVAADEVVPYPVWLHMVMGTPYLMQQSNWRRYTHESTTDPSTWLPPALSKKTCSLPRAGKLLRTFSISMATMSLLILWQDNEPCDKRG